MKWIFGLLLASALLLAGYALCKANRLEAEMKPKVHLIASAAAAR